MTTNEHVELVAKAMLTVMDKQVYGVKDSALFGLLSGDIRFGYEPRFLNAVLSHLISIRAIDMLSHFHLNDPNPHVMFIKSGVLTALSANDGDTWVEELQPSVTMQNKIANPKSGAQVTPIQSRFKSVSITSAFSPLKPVA